MNYIILIILLSSFIYYKYNELYSKHSLVSKEEFGNFNELKDKGLIINIPLSRNINIVTDQIYNPMYYLGAIIDQFGSNFQNIKSNGSIDNLQKVNEGKAEFGLCNEKYFLIQF